MLHSKLIPCLFMTLAVLACAQDAPADFKQLTPPNAAEQHITTKLAVTNVKVGILPGENIGQTAVGLFCLNKRPDVASEDWAKKYGQFAQRTVIEELKHLQYPLAGLDDVSLFGEREVATPDFRIGGVLRELQLDTCHVGTQYSGSIFVRFEWQLYSEAEQKVVFKQMTEGYIHSGEGLADLGKKPIISSFDNFLAAPEFQAALKPSGVESSANAVMETTGSTVSADQHVDMLVLANASPLPGGTQKNQEKLRSAVVTLKTATGQGSGFYVDRAGYILTDYHVVAGSKTAKVKLTNGDQLIAEVVRYDAKRDVALLKTQEVDVAPLAIRRSAPEIGEDVYAIGTPLGMESTITRGLLSAIRQFNGQRLLQSDVLITHGNSGGPLLDASGAVIGLSESSLARDERFTFFTPITDALALLKIEIRSR